MGSSVPNTHSGTSESDFQPAPSNPIAKCVVGSSAMRRTSPPTYLSAAPAAGAAPAGSEPKCAVASFTSSSWS